MNTVMTVIIIVFACIGSACVVGVLVAAVMVGAKSEEIMKDIMQSVEGKKQSEK